MAAAEPEGEGQALCLQALVPPESQLKKGNKALRGLNPESSAASRYSGAEVATSQEHTPAREIPPQMQGKHTVCPHQLDWKNVLLTGH